MPIRGDRLRWPPRPGKKSGDTLPGTRRPVSNGAQSGDAKQELQQPDKTDVSADREAAHPREPIQPTHNDAGQ